MYAPAVQSEAGRTNPSADDEVVAVERQVVHPPVRGHPHAEAEEVGKLPSSEERLQRVPGGCELSDCAHQCGAQAAPDQAPDAEPEQRQRDRYAAIPDDVADHVDEELALEVEAPAQQRTRGDRCPVDGKADGENAEDRGNERVAHGRAAKRRQQRDRGRDRDAEQNGEGEGRAHVTRRQIGSLYYGSADSEVAQRARQPKHHHRQRQDAEVGRRQKARQHGADGELREHADARARKPPLRGTGRPVGQRLGFHGHRSRHITFRSEARNADVPAGQGAGPARPRHVQSPALRRRPPGGPYPQWPSRQGTA